MMDTTSPIQGTDLPTGKAVVAHPSNEVHARGMADDNGIDQVILRDFIPSSHVYIIDFDKALELPDEWVFNA